MTLDAALAATPTHATFWDVDQVPLATYAYNIATMGGSRDSVPPLRNGGTDVVVPFRPGEVWVPKMPGSRTLTLAMWVQGSDLQGRVEADFRRVYAANWRMLKRLLWRTDRQLALGKRMWFPDGSLRRVEAKAEFVGGLEPEMLGPGHGAFTADLKLADPFFYEPLPVDDAARFDPATHRYAFTATSPGTAPARFTVDNPGDDTARALVMEFVSGGIYYLANETTGVEIRVDARTDVRLDTTTMQATRVADGGLLTDVVQVTGGPYYVPYWMYLVRGVNQMAFRADLGPGSVRAYFRPVYL